MFSGIGPSVDDSGRLSMLALSTPGSPTARDNFLKVGGVF